MPAGTEPEMVAAACMASTGTQPLAAGENTVPHRAVDGSGNCFGGGDQCFKRTIREISALLNQGFHIRRHATYMITESQMFNAVPDAANRML